MISHPVSVIVCRNSLIKPIIPASRFICKEMPSAYWRKYFFSSWVQSYLKATLHPCAAFSVHCAIFDFFYEKMLFFNISFTDFS